VKKKLSKMHYQNLTRPVLLLLVITALMCGGLLLSAHSEASGSMRQASGSPDGPFASPSPSPTPRNREELPQDSDEVVKFDTNLTNIFFTAADKNKRFISDLKAEDIRVLEDGRPQENLHVPDEYRSAAVTRDPD
jgi:hypothetical protein